MLKNVSFQARHYLDKKLKPFGLNYVITDLLYIQIFKHGDL